MAETAAINLQQVARVVGLKLDQVQATVELLDAGNTVPFITRYRKDQTGGLDEEQIRKIQDQMTLARALAERKQTILRSIESQKKLTEELAAKINGATTAKRLEDLYLPYKPKKQTLATIARQRGLEPFAIEILDRADSCSDLEARAADFINPDKEVTIAADVLLGAGHILAEHFSEQISLRQKLREILRRTGKFQSTKAIADGPSVEGPATEGSLGRGPDKSQEKPAKPATTEASVPETPAAEESAIETPVTEAPATTETPAIEALAEKKVEPTTPIVEPISSDSEDRPPSPTPVAAELKPEKPAESPKAEEPVEPKPAEESVEQKSAESKPEKQKPAVAKPQPISKAQMRKRQALEKKLKAFADYFEFSEEVRKIPPHRVLALNRGEKSKILRIKIELDREAMERAALELMVPTDHPQADFLQGCVKDAVTRLVIPALERELRRELTEKAELHAVTVFAKNLRNLLLQPPITDCRVLAADPGFRSGCKLAALDQFGNILAHDTVYLFGKASKPEEAKRKVAELVERFSLGVVVIGNGTACRETEEFFSKMIEKELAGKEVAYVIVNEAGASVYSASQIGREEFPEYDATVRGAISIGRRLQDPLSELVKIDPANIGVGLYQHDVKAKHLKQTLQEVVESCVNFVGVDVNSASPALLQRVSGLNQLTARRIFDHRRQNGPFRSREHLMNVPGFGDATFVQAAGFLKIAQGLNPLDATWIHPESYPVAEKMLTSLGFSPENLSNKEIKEALVEKVKSIDLKVMAEQLEVGHMSLKDILDQLVRPGRDPREDLPTPVFKRGVLKVDDLEKDMELTGTVLNVVDFGVFVDIGMHDSGLVHVSQLANQFVRDPHDVVAVGNVVKVWVLDVDRERRRVSLTMIQPGIKQEEPKKSRRSRKPDYRKNKDEQSSDRKKEGRSEGGRPPRRGRGGRDQSRRSEKVAYRPKPQKKPVVPITDQMKKGKEPMRSFGDLAQFFDGNEESKETGGDKKDSGK
jgi:protein Tex